MNKQRAIDILTEYMSKEKAEELVNCIMLATREELVSDEWKEYFTGK